MPLACALPLCVPARRARRWRLILGPVLALGLAGCGLGLTPAEEPGATAAGAGPPPSRMGVAGGAIIIAGPKGYCIDRGASRDSGGAAALTVLSGCRQLGGALFGPRPAHPAVLTAAVAGDGMLVDVEAAAPELARFFADTPGRAALSRSGAAETVALQESFAEQGVFYLHLTDSAPFSWGAVQPGYWRALLQAGGRMVTLSVLTRTDAPLDRDQGLALLRDFAGAVRAATPAAEAADLPEVAKGGE